MVGGHVLQRLLEDSYYSHVHSIGRRKLDLEHPKLEQAVVDFGRLSEHGALFEADHVYCCLGTTIKKAGSKEAFSRVDKEYPLQMADLAASGNAMAYAIITALGADRKSLFFYNRVKGEVETELGKKSIPSITILQPSLLLGDREENRLGEKISQVVMRNTGSLMVGPLKSYKAIEGEQVARAMVMITKEERKGLTRYPNEVLLEY